ncbi:NADH-quinone oxidoreductase subunit NuoH [Taibaiella chishuiensis]|uniref:NADH-quinone oxidoreductase subunit H n=1 Tax=Taibaiella chishuiensis TaxID=1434707 RepID=A0A2P8D9Z0_9BACT|nr:NADH-quinone oxidoreductase subunit NuoH [Taibaiella chishuiensis]PSK94017.1 NADH dehydrogenase subunit H [Taibaiella chishuiensis]
MLLLSIDWIFIIEKVALILVIILASFGIAAYATWGERKVAAIMQDRIGPARAGIFGLLQPLADGGKLFFKEEIVPDRSTKTLFILGPALFMITALMTSAVIPWGPDFTISTDSGIRTVSLQVADINIGILYIFGVVSLGIYGVMLGGWSSNNKFSLLSAIRAASQSISYELAMGLSLIAVLMLTGSLSLRDIVSQQHGFWQDGYFSWNFFKQPVAFLVFLVCTFAELNRAPFDMPECESELNMGYHQEYSSMKLGLYLFAEYINMFISSAVLSTVFFGGYNFPWMDQVASAVPSGLFSLICVSVLMIKVIGFILFFMFIRWTLPRFRYDQLLNLGWKGLIPLALLNLVITGGVILFFFNK